MTAAPDEGIDYSRAAAGLAGWIERNNERPALVLPKLSRPIRAGGIASVQVFPRLDPQNVPERLNLLELDALPFVLFGGVLTDETAQEVLTVVDLVRALHGLGPDESLCFVAQTVLWIVELNRLNAGTGSMFDESWLGQVDLSTPEKYAGVLDAISEPRLRVETMLKFWHSAGARLGTMPLFDRSPDGRPGRPNYFWFPPRWITAAQLKDLEEDEEHPPRIPILVDPAAADVTRRFAEWHETVSRVTGGPAISFSLTSPESSPDELASRAIGLSDGLRTAGLSSAPVELSPDDLRAVREKRFKCVLPLYIPGATEGRSSNVLFLGGAEVVLPDASFALFLRLIVALMETDDGFVARGQMRSGGGLIDEGLYRPVQIDQALSRIRERCRTALRGLPPTKFIEVSRGMVRVSTHPSCVTWDRQKLMGHPERAIRDLARRLPESRVAP